MKKKISEDHRKISIHNQIDNVADMNADIGIELMYTHKIRMGHNISTHPKCQGIHGENWMITLYITTSNGFYDPKEEPFIIDFGEIKSFLDDELRNFDHKFLTKDGKLWEALNKIKPDSAILTDFEPSCENLAIWLLYELRPKIGDTFHRYLKGIKICESEESKAVYVGE